jgi:GT2 family glycosyltransferase
MNSIVALPPTSLIICSRNRPQLLYETVVSVLHGRDVPDEIIVIDQSAEPNSVLENLQTERDCTVRYFHNQVAGVGRARNLGIRRAQNDLIVLLDDDMYVAPTWLRALISALLCGGTKTIVTGRVIPEEQSQKTFTPSLNTQKETEIYRGRIKQDVLYSGNMALYRSNLNAVGMFDERLGPGTAFPAAEDNDLGYRFLKKGYEIVYVPDAQVIHRAWRATRDFLPLRWNYGKGRGAFYAKHLEWRDAYMFQRMVRDIRDHLVASLFEARRQREKAMGDATLAIAIIYGVMQWLLTERGA